MPVLPQKRKVEVFFGVHNRKQTLPLSVTPLFLWHDEGGEEVSREKNITVCIHCVPRHYWAEAADWRWPTLPHHEETVYDCVLACGCLQLCSSMYTAGICLVSLQGVRARIQSESVPPSVWNEAKTWLGSHWKHLAGIPGVLFEHFPLN